MSQRVNCVKSNYEKCKNSSTSNESNINELQIIGTTNDDQTFTFTDTEQTLTKSLSNVILNDGWIITNNNHFTVPQTGLYYISYSTGYEVIPPGFVGGATAVKVSTCVMIDDITLIPQSFVISALSVLEQVEYISKTFIAQLTKDSTLRIDVTGQSTGFGVPTGSATTSIGLDGTTSLTIYKLK